jgi:hypothetical protein
MSSVFSISYFFFCLCYSLFFLILSIVWMETFDLFDGLEAVELGSVDQTLWLKHLYSKGRCINE